MLHFFLRLPLIFSDDSLLLQNTQPWPGQVIVVQHDDWLIFPGDLAFSLHCRPRGEAGASAVARQGELFLRKVEQDQKSNRSANAMENLSNNMKTK